MQDQMCHKSIVWRMINHATEKERLRDEHSGALGHDVVATPLAPRRHLQLLHAFGIPVPSLVGLERSSISRQSRERSGDFHGKWCRVTMEPLTFIRSQIGICAVIEA